MELKNITTSLSSMHAQLVEEQRRADEVMQQYREEERQHASMLEYVAPKTGILAQSEAMAAATKAQANLSQAHRAFILGLSKMRSTGHQLPATAPSPPERINDPVHGRRKIEL